MTTLQRIDTQTGRQSTSAVRSGQRITLAAGELLKLEAAGIQSARQGADLVLWVPSDNGGEPQRVVVANFFASDSLGMVQLGADGQAEMLTAQSTVKSMAQLQANGFEEQNPQDATKAEANGTHETGLLLLSDQPFDLRVTDTQGLTSTFKPVEPLSIAGQSLVSYTTASAVLMSESVDTNAKHIDVDPPKTPTVELPSSILTLGQIQYLNYPSVQSGVTWSGQAEPYSTVTLTCSDAAGHQVQAKAQASGNGQWSVAVGGSAWLGFTDGSVQASVVATDSSGNSSPASLPVSFELHKDRPAQPSAVLDSASDSGALHSDRITNNTVPGFVATTNAGSTPFRIYVDVNNNGAIDASDVWINGTTNAQGTASVLSPQILSSDGVHKFLFTQFDVWGNESEPYPLTVTIDTRANAVVLDAVTGDDTISYQDTGDANAASTTVALTGSGAEANATVHVTLKQGATLVDLGTVVADAYGVWQSGVLGSVLQNSFVNGVLTVSATQTDVAGNTSTATTRNVALRNTPLPPIQNLALASGEDSGIDHTDKITNHATLKLTGQGEAGTSVRLYVDTNGSGSVDTGDTLVGQADIGLNGQFEITLNTALADATYTFLAQAYDAASHTISATSTPGSSLNVRIDTHVDPVTFDTIAGDNVVVKNELASGVTITGHAEANAKVTVTLRNGANASSDELTAGTDGVWTLNLTNAVAAAIHDGTITVEATQTDVAGNTTPVSATTQFTLISADIKAPGLLVLDASDDTGSSHTDGVTSHTTGLTLSTTIDHLTIAHGQVTVFDDVNHNGVLDSGETIASGAADANGVFQADVSLAEGSHLLYSIVTDEFGQTSGVSGGTVIKVDASVNAPDHVVIAGNNIVNAAKAATANAVKVEGYAEIDASVTLVWSSSGTDFLTKTVSTDPVSGQWSWVLSAAEVETLKLHQGTLTFKSQQTDLAGNVSTWTSTSVLVDTHIPGQPTTTTDADAYNAAAQRPWHDGLSWADIYTDVNGVAQAKPVSVAVALTTEIFVGDTVTLNWAGQTTTQTITTDDLALGYILVQVDSAKIATAGVRSGLTLTASFLDAAGNQGADFEVLTGMNVTLDLRAPVLDFSTDAHTNNAPGANDTTQYTNHSTSNTDSTKHYLTVTGTADPDSQVTLFIDANLDGNADTVLAIVQADANGQFSTSFLNSLVDGTYNVRAYSSIAGHRSSVSDVVHLSVDTATPAAPVITPSAVTSDNYISAAERDQSVTLTGTGEPYATLAWNLLNTSTNVQGSTYHVQVAADGTWSLSLGWYALGQVGDGSLKLSMSQTDLAGNISSPSTNPTPTDVRLFTLDTQVLAPTLKKIDGHDVTVNNWVNAEEASGTVSLSGGGEVGAAIKIKSLRGVAGTLGPLSAGTVDADGGWSYNLTSADLQVLGNGSVSVEFYQIDKAGNQSTTQTQTFKIDTLVSAPTLDTVAGNDIINAAEKANGITLTGQAEPNAVVTVTLKQANHADQIFTANVGNASTWALPLSAADLSSFADGSLTIEVKQIDAAGNDSSSSRFSAITTKTVSLATLPLSDVAIDPVSVDDKVSLSEQSADVTLSGTGPAQTSVTVVLSGKLHSVEKTGSIEANGVWRINLTPTDMASLGQGEVSVQVSAHNTSDQSSAVVSKVFTLDVTEPSPSLSQVSGNALVNAAEALAGVDVTGTGVVGHLVVVTLQGSNPNSIVRTVSVGSDGRWQAHLSESDFLRLGEGNISVSAVQKTSSLATTTSVAVTSSFLVDTIAPALPQDGDASKQHSQTYNVSGALQNGVTVAEAEAGVLVSVPLWPTAVVGDVVTVYWGLQRIQHALTTTDLQSTDSTLLLTVGRDIITTQGSGVLDVTVVYTDAAGNSSAALTLASSVNVIAPAQAPQIDTVSTDGYLNASERAAITVNHPLHISGTAAGSGTVKLTLLSESGVTLELNNLTVTGGVWSADLTASQVDNLGEGRISMSAVFTRVDAAVSLPGTGTFTYDKTPPSAPSQASADAAGQANALYELAGGLIPLNGQPTEAASSVQVRVALPANAASNDTLTLYWGGQEDGKVVTATVNQAAINQGYMVVTVPPSVISEYGDSLALTIQAMYTDRAGNNGAVFDVWTGKVDAAPLAPTIDAPAMGEWLNVSEADAGWGFSGTCEAGATVKVTLVGSSGSLHAITQDVTVPNNATTWTMSGLTKAQAASLGDGEVTVTASQNDATGNSSANATVKFKIDLTPPAAPVVNDVANLTYGQTQNGSDFTGTAVASASVTLTFTQGSNSISKTVSANDAGVWRMTLSKDEFSTLSANNLSSATTHISATQTDVAGNLSTVTGKDFHFSSDVLTAPTISAVTGLNLTSDAFINAGDIPQTGELTLSGSGGVVGQKVHLKFTVADVLHEFDADVGALGAWTRTLTATEVSSLGQGVASLTATSRTFTGAQLDNESVSTTFMAANQSTFAIDTVQPNLLQATLTATGVNGNAKAGDQLLVTLVASEDLSWPTGADANLALNFGDQATHTASFNAAASRAAGNNRMVFTYTVGATDNASSVTLGALSLVDATKTFSDSAGNPLTLTTVPTLRPNAVVVDTIAPNKPSTPPSVNEAAVGSLGGTTINFDEANASVLVRVDLTGTNAVSGDSLKVNWNGVTVNKLLSSTDINNHYATLSVPLSTVGLVQGAAGQISITSWLVDQSGNASAVSDAKSLVIDTIAPDAMSIAANWMTDDKVNATEGLLNGSGINQAMTGGGVEAGATVHATLRWGSDAATTLSVDQPTASTWSISASQLQTWMNQHTSDGAFTLSVWQEDAAANLSGITQQQYYIDRQVPNSPVITNTGSASDGWVNNADATQGVTFTVSLVGTQAVAGDKVHLEGLNADVDYVITSADIAAGAASVRVDSTHLLQSTSPWALLPVTKTVSAYIIDQGGNKSLTANTTSINIDTNVETLTVSDAAGTAGASGGVSPAQSVVGVNFEGAKAESGSKLTITLTGTTGNVLRLVPTVNSDGTFSQPLNLSDLTALGEGAVAYKLQQVDPAGNVSIAKEGSFNVTLSVTPPVFNDFVGDNVLGFADVTKTQQLTGTGVTGSTVSIDFKVGGLVKLTKTTTVLADGTWSVDVVKNTNTDDFTTLLGTGDRASVTVSATASLVLNGAMSTSAATLLAVEIVKGRPTVASLTPTLFDANGDGANNDGFLVSFSEAVRVKDLSTLSAMTLSGNKTWGAGARIEAVNPVSKNGSLYATQFKIYLGYGNTVALNDTFTFDPTKVVNQAENTADSLTASTALKVTVPSLAVPGRPVPPANFSGDNFVNLAEVSSQTTWPSPTYTFAALTTASRLNLYNNGTLVAHTGLIAQNATSNSGVAWSYDVANPWGADGQKTLVAQLVDTAGHASLISVPKNVTVDTVLQAGFNSFTVLSDVAPTGGNLGAGDKVRVVFNESVGLTSLPSSLGTGATYTAVGGVNSKSTTWDITLGTGANVAGNTQLQFAVTDAAGNSGNLVATTPADPFNTPGAPSIGNVTSDNVINATERSAVQSVTVNFANAKVGDRVTLLMDGVALTDATGQALTKLIVAGDITGSKASVSFAVPANSWGSDGTRYLTASVQRDTQTQTSVAREVYVAADSAHWSVAGGAASAIWFDPNTLDASGIGQSVMTWSSSVGGSTAGLASIASGTATDATRPLLVRVNGQQTLLFNGSQALNYNDPLGILWNSGKATGMDVTGFVAATPTNLNGGFQAALAFWGSSTGSTGAKLGIGPSSALAYTNYGKWDFSGTANSVSLSNATTLTLRSYLSTDLNAYVFEGYNQNLLQLSTSGNYAQINMSAAPTRLRIGADANQANISFAWQGYISDAIWLNYKATDALMQEVQVYLGVKYGSSGSPTARAVNSFGVAVDASYDLSVSSNSSLLLDDRLLLTDAATKDTVITGGADYVAAGRGDDTVQIKDLTFRTLDGGLGYDTLSLSASYSGSSSIVLADFVSNARGMSTDAIANARVNAAGFHKLQGFEAIDLSSNTSRQVLSVTATDVNQLSDNNTLEVRLGTNDVMLATGFNTPVRGIFSFNGNWYDQQYVLVDNTNAANTVTLYSRGGDQAADLNSFKMLTTTSMQLNFDHAMLGVPLKADFSASLLNADGSLGTTQAIGSVSTVNLRQGLSIGFTAALQGPVKITYSPTNTANTLTDEGAGRTMSHTTWLVGTDSGDTLDGSHLGTVVESPGLTMLGGASSDRLIGGQGADVLIGGLGVDTMTGGLGSDTFKYVNEIQGAGAAAGLGGKDGDVITDFNFGTALVNGAQVSSEKEADRLDLSMLFDPAALTGLKGTPAGAHDDAALLVNSKFMDIVQTRVSRNGVANNDWEVWVDRDGGGNYQRLVTLQGAGDAAVALSAEHYGTKTTSQLLEQLLLEGRLVVAHA